MQTWKKTFFCELYKFKNTDLADKTRKLEQIRNYNEQRKSNVEQK